MFAWRSRRWPKVQGLIYEVSMRSPALEFRLGRLTIPRLAWQDVVYRYEVNGRYLTSTKREFGVWMKHPLRRYTPDTVAPVTYDPDNPKRAVLEPGIGAWLVAEWLFSLALFGAFVYLAFRIYSK